MPDNQKQELLDAYASVSSAVNSLTSCANAVAMFPNSGLAKDLPSLIEAANDAIVDFEMMLDRVDVVTIDPEE